MRILWRRKRKRRRRMTRSTNVFMKTMLMKL
jgi:hypothetical protein